MRRKPVFQSNDLAECEAYASRQLQRYDRRLLKVRARQDHFGFVTGRNQQLERLAQRIIRRRDAFHVSVMYVLHPQEWR
jgi:hypothetical protein